VTALVIKITDLTGMDAAHSKLKSLKIKIYDSLSFLKMIVHENMSDENNSLKKDEN
jgi:hypothetical protein